MKRKKWKVKEKGEKRREREGNERKEGWIKKVE